MAESQIIPVIRIWAAMAWADGELADAELSALKRLIDAAGLEGEERAMVSGWLESRTELDDAGMAALSVDARHGVYRAACRIAALDRVVHESERSLLARLRDALGLAPDEAHEIEAGVPGITVG